MRSSKVGFRGRTIAAVTGVLAAGALAAASPAGATTHPVPVNGPIYFSVLGDGELLPVGATAPVDMTGHNHNPAVSVNGELLAVFGPVLGNEGSNRLYVRGVGGRGEHLVKVTPFADGTTNMSTVSWAPDNKTLMVVHIKKTGGAAIWAVDSDTGAKNLLVDLRKDTVNGAPAWAPNGLEIAYWRHSATAESLQTLRTTGHQVPAGQKPHTLADALAPSIAAQLSWSPDSTRLLYAGFDARNRSGNIRVELVTEGRGVWLTNSTSYTDLSVPAYSPDGKSIAVVRTHAPQNPYSYGIAQYSLTGHFQKWLLPYYLTDNDYSGLQWAAKAS